MGTYCIQYPGGFLFNAMGNHTYCVAVRARCVPTASIFWPVGPGTRPCPRGDIVHRFINEHDVAWLAPYSHHLLTFDSAEAAEAFAIRFARFVPHEIVEVDWTFAEWGLQHNWVWGNGEYWPGS